MSGNNLAFFIDQLTDPNARENFVKLQDFLDREALFTGFRHFEVTLPSAELHHRFVHNLGFSPKDILLTSTQGVGVVTFNQDLTSSSELDLTVTGACVVRFIAGTFGEGTK